MNRTKILSSRIRDQFDVVFVRSRAKELSRLLGFESQDQVRIATAVSEIARNSFEYGSGGEAEFSLLYDEDLKLEIVINDSGKGIENIQKILSGDFQSATGMGVGILGAKRLVDEFEITTSKTGGASVVLRKILKGRPMPGAKQLNAILGELSAAKKDSQLNLVEEQNGELVRALTELESKQEELVELNNELEATNRGVVALYGELDDKAEALRKASQLKTRFLSNITHEFRTPLGSILTLSGLLLDGSEGKMTEDQSTIVELIRKSSQSLLELVNDLLDLAKVEAGKIPLKVSDFELSEIFLSLKRLMKPLAALNPDVQLIFQDAPEVLFHSDEGKISQVLKNLVSNALKYTVKGTVTVSASLSADGMLEFVVADTGIGIAPENLDRIFEEFVQIESIQQSKYKGTGLGLSLTQKLVQLLGGDLKVESEVGKGSKFIAKLPIQYTGPQVGQYFHDARPVAASPKESQSERIRILIVDDEEDERAFLKQALYSFYHCEILVAANGQVALDLSKRFRPDLIFLDLNMPELDGFETYAALRVHAELKTIPVVVHSAKILSDEDLARLSGIIGSVSKAENEEETLAQLNRVLSQLPFARLPMRS